MWQKNLLFATVCLVGLSALAGSLLRRDSIRTPRDFAPDRFVTQASVGPSATANRSSAGESQSSVEDESPSILRPAVKHGTGDIGEALARLNQEFADHWKQEDLTPTSRADDLTIARRLSLALTGTVPSLEEIRALERVRPEERLEWWTSHLLEDRRYADYLAERLARAYVGVEDGPFLIYRRRKFVTWLSDNLSKNVPYDEIIRKLIAEDGLWTGTPATNFITVTSRQDMDNEPDEIRLAGRTTRAFLGMRIDCLQCHDDKLGTIMLGDAENPQYGTQQDFHQLAAFFSDVSVGLVGVYDADKPYEYKYLNAEDETVVPPKVPFAPEARDGHGNRREQLARWVTSPQNKPFARAIVNRMWALMFGRPLVEPIDDIQLFGKYPPGLQLLADDLVEHGYDLRRLIRVIAASDAFQRDSRADFEITPRHEQHWASFPLSRLRPEQVAGSLIQASSLTTIDADSHIIAQLAKSGQTNDFVKRYGDIGQDEFDNRAGTIPQRLLLMNGELVKERTKENIVMNAATRIALQTPSDEQAVEVVYLAVLTRRPEADERQHFAARLKDTKQQERIAAVEDLYWVLLNGTEFSWNH
jgi:hypothetical protein